MYLYFYQIENLLQIISRNQCIATGDFGPDFITADDKKILLKYGVDFNKLYNKSTASDSVFNLFNLGMLADSLTEIEKVNGTFTQLETFIKCGMYLPESSKNKLLVECMSNLTFVELQNDANCNMIKGDLIQGLKDRKPLYKIISDVGHKTGHWCLHNILSYYHQMAWEQATAIEIQKRNIGKDPIVFKTVHSYCSEDCVQLFLTNGLKSEPHVFKLSSLDASWSNLGKQKKDYLPTINPIHYGCQCSLHERPTGYLWNPEKQSFSTPDPEYRKQTAMKRPLIRVMIGGIEKFL